MLFGVGYSKFVLSAGDAGLRLLLCGALLALGACASKRTSYAPVAAAYNDGAPAARVAGYRQYQHRLLLEEDGIAEQSPPVHRAEREPDDPTEVFSPNYGSVEPGGSGDGATAVEPDVGATDAHDPFLDSPRWDKYKSRDGGIGEVGSLDHVQKRVRQAWLR